MGIVRGIVRFIVGAVLGIVSALALTPAIAATASVDGTSSLALLAVILLSALLAVFAPSLRRAFGRGFLLAGLACLALPLSTMLLAGRAAGEVMSSSGNDGATMIGAGIGATMMTGFAAFVGFFLGAIFIIVGLVLALGGRREVVMVDALAGPARTGRREPTM